MPPSSRPRIVAFAYNFDPESGSEAGVGWAWSQLLAGIGPTTVLAREWPGRHDAVMEAIAALPEDRRPELVFVPLPGWLRPLARLHRNQQLEYVAWMRAALGVARREHALRPFDLAWHLTWANGWIGSSASQLGVPFVFGPVGAGAGPPWRLVPMLGPRGVAAELARSGLRTLSRYVNPFAHGSWRRAALILAQNPETRDWLPVGPRRRTEIMPNALFEHMPATRVPRPAGDPPVALFAARFLPWKGAVLALRAIALRPRWRLAVYGDGGEAAALRAEAERLGLLGRVEFRGWADRAEVLRAMRDEADVLVFPSLHEEGGWTVAEATVIGLPVVCLDRGGPPILGGRTVHAGWPRETERRFAEALDEALGAPAGELAWPMDIDGRRNVIRAMLVAHGLIAPATETR